MSERTKTLIGQLLFLLIGAGFYAYAVLSNFPILSRNDIGSGGVPKLICALIIGLSALKIVLTLKRKPKQVQTAGENNVNYAKGLAVIGVLALYCLFISKVGFPIANTLMLFCEMCLLSPPEKRNFGLFALISILLTAIVFVIFYYGLDLLLPAGPLKEFL